MRKGGAHKKHRQQNASSYASSTIASEPTPSTGLPNIVEDYLAALEDKDPATVERIRAGYDEARERLVTLRVNTLKATRAAICQALDDASISYEPIAWYKDALVLPQANEHDIWQLPIYKNGEIYLQSLSSMLPPLILGPTIGADILDMCAAPGGKTSELAALTNNQAHLTACEVKPVRAEKLAYNLNKLGVSNINIMRIDARNLDEFFSFDQILLDAPCTGSGTIYPDNPRALKRVTPELLRKTTRSQTALLDRALTILKPGGTLVYSTCSILPEENDCQIMRALKRHRDCEIVPLDAHPIINANKLPLLPVNIANANVSCGITILPTRFFEGFYLAQIKKNTQR